MWLEPVCESLYIGPEQKLYGKNADGGDADVLYLVSCMWHIGLFWNTESMFNESLGRAAVWHYQKKK